MTELPLDIIAHQLDRLLLPVLLLLTLALARRAAARGDTQSLAASARLARGLLVALGVWWLWLGLTAFIGIPRDQWIGPFDRLLQTVVLALVAWLLVGEDAAGLSRLGRLGLAAAFAAFLPVYLGWAPRWARAMQVPGGGAGLPTGTARAWDAWLVLLAFSLLMLLWTRRRGAWAGSLAVVGCLLAASLLDVLQPSDAAAAFAPVWGRLGLLGIGVGLAAQALQRNLELGLAAEWLPAPSARPGGPAPAAPAAPVQSLPPAESQDRALARSVAQQAAQIGRLADALAALGARLDRLERTPRPDEATAARLRDCQEALERLPVGLLLTDARGRLSYANPAAAALLGQAPRSGQALTEALGAGEPVQAAFRDLLRDGQARLPRASLGQPTATLDLDLHAFRGPEGGIRALLALLAPADAGPEPAALALVPELLEAIRAPITSIKGYSHLIQGGQTMLTGEGQVERYLERIDANLSSVKVMLRNLSKVLDLEPTAASDPAAMPVDLAASLDGALERATALLREKGLRAERGAVILPPLLGLDEAALDLVLDNLLLHAVQRSPLGGDLQLNAALEADLLTVAVLDRGRPPREESLDGPEPSPALDDPATPTELKAALLLCRRAGGRLRLRQADEGLWTYASLACRPAPWPAAPAARWAAPSHAVPELAGSDLRA